MNIEIYKNSSCINKVDKSISLLSTFENARIKENTSLYNLSLIIGNINSIENINNWNYAYIPKFQKYYFINDKIMLNGNNVSLKLKEDVLMSFKDTILNSDFIVSRQETKRNNFLIDTQLPIHVDKSLEIKKIGKALFSEKSNLELNIVLNTNGILKESE